MRIAYLINQYPMPSQTFIRREIAALESLGHHVDRFALRAWDKALVDPSDVHERAKTRYVTSLGVVRLALALVATALTGPFRFLQAIKLSVQIAWTSNRPVLLHMAYLAEACVLKNWLRSADSEHLHAHFATNSAEVAMLCHTLGGPDYSFTVHGPEDIDLAPVQALGLKVRHAAFVVAISKYTRSQIQRFSDYQDWGKVNIVRCGLEFTNYDPQPVSADSSQLLCIGRLVEQKGQLVLIEAAARLAEKGVEFKLTLIGDGESRGAIEAAIKRHGLEDVIALCGWATNDQVTEQLLKARGLVLPSFAEGLPIVIMESFALCRPVISTWVAGIPELVRHEVNGWLIAPGDVDGLSQAMEAFLTAPIDHLEAMGRQGRDAVVELCNLTEQAKILERLIRRSIEHQQTGERGSSPGAAPGAERN